MEQQFPTPPPERSLFGLNIDANTSYSLRSAASWAKLLGIIGLICGILFMILGILAQIALSSYSSRYEGYGGGYSTTTLANIGLITYVIIGLVFIVSSIFALNFGNKISRALRTSDQYSLNSGFSGARNYFAFWAILMILFLLLIIIGVLSNLGR